MSERGRILPKLLPALLLLLGAALFLFGRVILAAHLPDVDITSPSAGESVSGMVPVVVSYSIDSGQVHDLTLSATGQTVSHVDLNQRTGTYTFNLNTASYPNGSLALSVEACSADQHSGHCSTDSVTVAVDNAPQHGAAPWIEIDSPEDGDTVSGIVIVSASFEYINAYTRTIHLYANGVEADSEVISVKVGAVTFSLDTTGYPDGPLALRVSECPPEGGSEYCRQDTVNVTVENVEEDTEAPEIEITSPDAGELLGAAPVSVSASLEDNIAVNTSSVAVMLDGANVTAQCTATAVSVSCSLTPADGAHSISIDCKDTSNNPAARKSVNFTLDTVAPSMAVTSHTNGSTVNSASVNLAGTVSDVTSGVASVEVNGTAAAVNGGNWTLNNFALDEGANAISVVAEDTAGHSRTVTLTINYVAPDTEKPVITLESPEAGELVGATPVLVSAVLEDNRGVATASVVVKLDGTSVTSQCTVTAVSVSCSLSPADGAHSVIIDCKDTSNNPAAQKSVSFKLDTIAPSVSVTSHTSGQVVVTPTVNLTGSVSDATSNVASVKVNGEDASLNGNSWSLSGFALDEGANAIVIVAEDAVGHTALANITINYVVPECSSDAACKDGDAHTQDVCMNPGAAAAACVHNNIECLNDSECNDSDAYTLDACTGAGTPQSSCAHAAIMCLSAADCDDGDAHTADECSAPGTTSSACSHSTIECLSNAECDDSTPLTLDTCNSPGTAASSCSHDPITCVSATDCEDGNDLTLDACIRPGTAQSDCTHTAITCITAADCDDDNAHTQDICSNGGTTTAACAHNNIECLSATDCDDGNAYTEDSCASAGTVS